MITIIAILLCTAVATPISEDEKGQEVVLVSEEPENTTVISGSFGTVYMYSRYKWAGRDPKKSIPMESPIDFVIIKHAGGLPCYDFITCAKKLQYIQTINFNEGMDDIYCSFLIGGDGNVYKGRGWNSQPEYHNNSIDIVLLGNFMIDPFTDPMINATKALLEYGVNNNKLTKKYRLVNHNQTKISLSPGINVIREDKNWPHYDPTVYIGTPLMFP